VPSVIDFGPNLAAKGTFTYSSTFKGELAQLNNGVLETYHNANPNGDTNGKLIWAGDFAETPQTLGIAFEGPTIVQRVVLRSVRPTTPSAHCSITILRRRWTAFGSYSSRGEE
jgi:hypothetical protein